MLSPTSDHGIFDLLTISYLPPMRREAVIQIGSGQLNVPRSRKSFVTFTCNADG